MKILQIKLLFILFFFSGLIHAQTVNYSDDEAFIIVQEMPRFPGCEDMEGTNKEKKHCAETKMLEFIYRNITYPTVARENGIEGMVVIGFIVEKDGSISNPTIIRDLSGGCAKEALRVVNIMPNWIPGKQKGELVRVQFNLPVRFKLTGSGYRPSSVSNSDSTAPTKKYININLRNYGKNNYEISTPTGTVYLAPRSSKWLKLEEGDELKYKKRGKEKQLLKVSPKLEGREVDVRNTIRKGVLHISKAKY